MTRRAAGLAALLLAAPAMVRAQTGLLVVAHGADSGWNARVEETVRQVRWDGPVCTAFLMGPATRDQGWNAGVRRLVAAGARRIVVVPLMVSSHGGHFDQIRWYAGLGPEAAWMRRMPGMSAMEPIHPVPMTVAPALDASPELADVLAERWGALSAADRKRTLLLVAHGPNADADAALWERDLATVARGIAARGVTVRIGLLRDDAPEAVRTASVRAMRDTITALASRSGDSVTALPVLISTSAINEVKIPEDLSGLPVRFVQASLAPSGTLAGWIAREGREAAAR